MSRGRGWLGIPGLAWGIVGASVPAHLGLALTTDLSPDEAYYLCAARFRAVIVDHPPLTLALLAISDRWSSAPVELRVRVWAIALSLLTSVLLVLLARERGADRQGCVMSAAVGTWALLPTAGAFVLTPDTILIPAVALALLAATRAPVDPGSVSARRGILPGLVGGLALLTAALAKVVALPIGALLAASSDKGRPGVRWALAIGPVLALPWLVPSLRFQLDHAYGTVAPGGWSVAGALGAVVAALGAQSALWSPLVLWHGARALPKAPLPDRAVVVGLSLLLLGSALVRGVPPEPNWWAPAALIVVVAASAHAGDLSSGARRVMLLTVLLPTAVGGAHAVHPFLPLPEQVDPTARLHGWSRSPTMNGSPSAVPSGPTSAPGVGRYGAPAERCAYHGECRDILFYFDEMRPNEGSRH